MVNIFRNKEINKLIKEVKKSSQLKHQEEEIEMYYEKLKEEIPILLTTSRGNE